MAKSKTFLLFGLALAVVLLVSSEVSADDTAQTGNVNQVNYAGRLGRWSGMTGRDHTGSDMPGHGRTGSDVPGTGRTGTYMPGRGRPGLLVPAEDMRRRDRKLNLKRSLNKRAIFFCCNGLGG